MTETGSASATNVPHDARSKREGSVLLLLHTAHTLVETVECEYVWERNPRVQLSFDVRRSPVDGEVEGFRWLGDRPGAQVQRGVRCEWWDVRQDRFRMEMWQGGRIMQVGLREFGRWLLWDRSIGARSGGGWEGGSERDLPTSLREFADSTSFLARWRLRFTGITEHVGRPTVVAHGVRRDLGASAAGEWSELVFDRETGTLLKRVDSDCQGVVWRTEARRVMYGGGFESSLFMFDIRGPLHGLKQS